MSEIIAHELKNDLEYIYKITGDLLNELESSYIQASEGINHEMLGRLKLALMDTGAVLQKDIFNCDFLITEMKLRSEGLNSGGMRSSVLNNSELNNRALNSYEG